MVLPGKLGGRVGRRRNFFQNPESFYDSGFFIAIFSDFYSVMGSCPISILPTKQVTRLSTPILRKALKDMLFAD
jgi:hypothetical protein